MKNLSGEKDKVKAWRWNVKPEDAVGLKVNLMMTPTHPELIQLITRRVTDRHGRCPRLRLGQRS
ncbi:MAG: hypothetical protein IT210_23810 [Armatimonadetes bacterium]|nr:hypothetical protein [Armatimonadota bacterium]